MFRILPLTIVVLFLASCKADKAEVSFSYGDVLAVLETGETQMIEFEAEFSALIDLDEDQRRKIDSMRDHAERFMSVEDFEVSQGDYGVDIEIEGEIPLTLDPSYPAPYILLVSDSPLGSDWVQVQMTNGSAFRDFASGGQAIDFMLAPDAHHPLKIKFKGEGVEIVAGGVEVDGKSHAIFKGTVDRSLSLTFKGGAYDEVGAAIQIRK